jgi:hypothetical protein
LLSVWIAPPNSSIQARSIETIKGELTRRLEPLLLCGYSAEAWRDRCRPGETLISVEVGYCEMTKPQARTQD